LPALFSLRPVSRWFTDSAEAGHFHRVGGREMLMRWLAMHQGGVEGLARWMRDRLRLRGIRDRRASINQAVAETGTSCD
jgi:hypothetical protein